MAISRLRARRLARYFDVDPLVVRIYVGLLVLLPLLSVALGRLFESIGAGFVIAGIISVTLMAIIPHDRRATGRTRTNGY